MINSKGRLSKRKFSKMSTIQFCSVAVCVFLMKLLCRFIAYLPRRSNLQSLNACQSDPTSNTLVYPKCRHLTFHPQYGFHILANSPNPKLFTNPEYCRSVRYSHIFFLSEYLIELNTANFKKFRLNVGPKICLIIV